MFRRDPIPLPLDATPYRFPKRHRLSPDEPLLNLAKFAVNGPGGKLTNEEIDRILYGGS